MRSCQWRRRRRVSDAAVYAPEQWKDGQRQTRTVVCSNISNVLSQPVLVLDRRRGSDVSCVVIVPCVCVLRAVVLTLGF